MLGVVGDPVRRSLSPILHNAALGELGLDWVYVAFPVAAADGHRVIDAARVLGVVGLSVTMPHKTAVVAGLDRLGPVAARLGSVNTVIAKGGAMIGESTDGPGLIDALRVHQRWAPDGCRCMVLGTGGAARATVLALAQAGAATVVVVGRNGDAAAAAAALAGRCGRVGGVDEAGDADLVVNATPVGMAALTVPAGGRDLPLGITADSFGPGQVVVDLIYSPPVTPLLAAAGRRGATAVNGFGMLLHQAGRQVAAWTGLDPPLEAMAAAGRDELAKRIGETEEQEKFVLP